MNVPRQYKPELFDILEIPPGLYSKRIICNHIQDFIQKNGWDRADTTTGEYITFERKSKITELRLINRYYSLDNPMMRLLTGISKIDKYIFYKDGQDINDCDKLYDIIYKKWKL